MTRAFNEPNPTHFQFYTSVHARNNTLYNGKEEETRTYVDDDDDDDVVQQMAKRREKK